MESAWARKAAAAARRAWLRAASAVVASIAEAARARRPASLSQDAQ